MESLLSNREVLTFNRNFTYAGIEFSLLDKIPWPIRQLAGKNKLPIDETVVEILQGKLGEKFVGTAVLYEVFAKQIDKPVAYCRLFTNADDMQIIYLICIAYSIALSYGYPEFRIIEFHGNSEKGKRFNGIMKDLGYIRIFHRKGSHNVWLKRRPKRPKRLQE